MSRDTADAATMGFRGGDCIVAASFDKPGAFVPLLDLVATQEKLKRAWLEAAVAWEVCASIHESFAKGKDALYSTRHADFVRHAEEARSKATA
jgi:hypothetical protein